MTIPDRCGMPPLTQNIEGLRLHALMVTIFGGAENVDEAKRKWRAWLVHCLMKAARHYTEARKNVLAQVVERHRSTQQLMTGRGLPILDFALDMEDCVTSLDKAIGCVQKLADSGQMPTPSVLELTEAIGELRALRNTQEHLHSRLFSGQAGKGPIFISVDESGDSMVLLKLRMQFGTLFRLIDTVYSDICTLFPGFDRNSIPQRAGHPVISASMTMTVTEAGDSRSGSQN